MAITTIAAALKHPVCNELGPGSRCLKPRTIVPAFHNCQPREICSMRSAEQPVDYFSFVLGKLGSARSLGFCAWVQSFRGVVLKTSAYSNAGRWLTISIVQVKFGFSPKLLYCFLCWPPVCILIHTNPPTNPNQSPAS